MRAHRHGQRGRPVPALHVGQHGETEGAGAHAGRVPAVRGAHAQGKGQRAKVVQRLQRPQSLLPSAHQCVFDYRDGDVFGCVADIGWITGHSYSVYGPLANGGTTVLFESTPVYPDPGTHA